MSFSLEDEGHVLQLSSVRIDNGHWVVLALEKYHNEFLLRINDGGGDHEIFFDVGQNRPLDMDLTSIVLGNRLANRSESDFQGT